MFEPSEIWFVVAAPFMGSFVSHAAMTWPSKFDEVWGRSRCGACGKTLSLHQLIPIVSFIAVGGKASCCGREIPRVHFIAELVTAAVAVAAVSVVSAPTSLAITLVGWVLLFAALVDLRLHRLPDIATLGVGALGLAYALMPGGTSLATSLLGALMGFASLWLIRETFFRLRGIEGMGLGDAKLFAAAGAWVGAPTLPYILAGAAFITLCAIALNNNNDMTGKAAFGPGLCISMFVVLITTHANI